jgi:hypothetical protein
VLPAAAGRHAGLRGGLARARRRHAGRRSPPQGAREVHAWLFGVSSFGTRARATVFVATVFVVAAGGTLWISDFLAAWFVFFVFVFVFYKKAHIRFASPPFVFSIVVFRERTGGEILERGMLEAALEEAGIGNGGGGGYTVDE